MLQYHPAYDVGHTMMRLIRIASNSKHLPIEIEKLFILDFFYLFPAHLSTLRVPKDMVKERNSVKVQFNNYFDPYYAKDTFLKLYPISSNAAQLLASKNVLEKDRFFEGFADMNRDTHLYIEISSDILHDNINTRLLDFVANRLASIPLLGPEGLKARSSLLEHRYDVS